MNRRDDCAETCSYKELSDRAEYHSVFPREEGFLCGQGSSKGASVFMNSPGQESAHRRWRCGVVQQTVKMDPGSSPGRQRSRLSGLDPESIFV